MKKIIFVLASMMAGQSVMAMPCDTGWSCKSKSGKYSVEVQRCRYVNSVGNLGSVKVDGKDVQGAQLTSSYDSKSIGGNILAFEISIPDSKNDARYLSFEVVGKTGQVTERVQPYNPGQQESAASEAISCAVIE